MNKTLFNDEIKKLISIDSFTFPFIQNSYNLEHSLGITFAETEMQPTPPLSKKAKNVESSPDNWIKLSPQFFLRPYFLDRAMRLVDAFSMIQEKNLVL